MQVASLRASRSQIDLAYVSLLKLPHCCQCPGSNSLLRNEIRSCNRYCMAASTSAIHDNGAAKCG